MRTLSDAKIDALAADIRDLAKEVAVVGSRFKDFKEWHRERIAQDDKRFEAFSQTLKHHGDALIVVNDLKKTVDGHDKQLKGLTMQGIEHSKRWALLIGVVVFVSSVMAKVVVELW